MKNYVYFNEKDFKLLKGDCFKILDDLEEKTFDFIFADPPYFLSGNGITCQNGKQVKCNKGNWDFSKTVEEKLAFHREWISKCKRVLKDNGSIMISSTLHSVYTIGVALEEEGFSIINNIIWRKTNPTPNLACRCFTHSTETIIWARKLLNNKKGKHTFNYELMKQINGGKQMKDFWYFDPILYESSTTPKREKLFGKHPTQKPESLLNRLLLAATNEGDYVLAPFNGTGTTGIVANKLKRKYCGIEIDKAYLQITKKRFKLEVSNGKKKI